MGSMSVLLLTLLILPLALARHRLEPLTRTIHAAGQYPGDFERYTAFLQPQGVAPAVKMYYFGDWASLNASTGAQAWFARVAAELEADAGPDGAFTCVQLGLQLPLNGGEARIANGEYTSALEALRVGLLALQRPIWLRVGYEFNGQWNNYSAATYVGAFRAIAAALHADPVLNLTCALVWDGSCDTTVDPTPFWPGADVVDWQGVNIFSSSSAPTTAPQSCPWYWATDARAAGIPLMIGEATPRGLNTSDPGGRALQAWFEPFLAMLAAFQPALISYIDMDWPVEDKRWVGWGDSRLEVPAAAPIAAVWVQELQKPVYAHRANRSTMLALLGIPPDVWGGQEQQQQKNL